ncbi:MULTISPECIES: hypothetical protein [Mesorhizobium]|uniref:hypothetical protein n=1 Tax=Mesorhizobium TaxID=68287 RepID=UPI00145A022F|nr:MULTISPECIES: hypothetical protein [Mesorhizobium]
MVELVFADHAHQRGNPLLPGSGQADKNGGTVPARPPFLCSLSKNEKLGPGEWKQLSNETCSASLQRVAPLGIDLSLLDPLVSAVLDQQQKLRREVRIEVRESVSDNRGSVDALKVGYRGAVELLLKIGESSGCLYAHGFAPARRSISSRKAPNGGRRGPPPA